MSACPSRIAIQAFAADPVQSRSSSIHQQSILVHTGIVWLRDFSFGMHGQLQEEESCVLRVLHVALLQRTQSIMLPRGASAYMKEVVGWCCFFRAYAVWLLRQAQVPMETPTRQSHVLD